MDNTIVNLNLTVAQVNTILKYLGNGSYLEVVDIINEIRLQAVPQIAQEAAPTTVASE